MNNRLFCLQSKVLTRRVSRAANTRSPAMDIIHPEFMESKGVVE